jgi:hypothetical protein
MFVRSLCLLTVTGALLFSGCSDSESKAPSAGLGFDDGASKGVAVSKLVKSTEETVLKLSTGAHVTIPADALEKDTVIGMKRPADKVALALVKTLPSEHVLASAPYVLTPHGSKFKRDVELSLPVAKSNGRQLAVAWLEDEDDTTWEIYETAPTVEGKSASLRVAHFSVLVLLELGESGVVDAQAMHDLDASISTSDASAEEDAAFDADVAVVDGGASGGDAAGADAAPDASLSQQVAARFAACEMQSHAGSFDFGLIADTQHEQCRVACLMAAECADFASEFCPLSEATIAFTECLERCDGFTRVSCVNGQQLQIQARVCDGIRECGSGQDESGCSGAFFSCGQEQVPMPEVCDGTEQCSNGLDEANCPNVGYFLCSDGHRVNSELRCDGQTQCADGSDELGCEMFTCTSGRVVPAKLVCNLARDCADGSDEPSHCLHLTCVDQSQVLQD